MYKVIREVFTKEETNHMRSAGYMALQTSGEDRPYRSGGRLQMCGSDQDFPGIMFWPSFVSTYLDGVREDPRLQEIVTDYLGPNVKQLNNQLYYRLPGDGDCFNWHTDMMFRKGMDSHEGYIQTIICIDRMDALNGGLAFADSAVLCTRENLRTPPKLFTPCDLPVCHSGDVVLWTLDQIHASRINTMDPRMTYMNGFARADVVEGFPWYLKDGELQEIDPEALPYT